MLAHRFERARSIRWPMFSATRWLPLTAGGALTVWVVCRRSSQMRGLTIGDRVFDADGRVIKPQAIIEVAVSIAKWGES
jgi:hypothetical protein